MQNSFARYAIIIIALALAADAYMLLSYSQNRNHAELGYYNTSPLGDAGGRSVPASCPSYPHSGNYGGSCSVASACGTNYGLYNCDGQCSASAPAVPANYGQACSTSMCGGGAGTIGCNGQCIGGGGGSANAGQPCSSGYNRCGMSSSGVFQCDGSCGATRPSDDLCAGTTVDLLYCGDGICNAGESQWSCPADCGAPPRDASACVLTATPDRILRGTRTVLAWSAQAASGCTITGVSQETGALLETVTLSGTGSRASTQLTENAYYSMTCTAADSGGGSCSTGQIPIEVVPIPQWNEK